MIMIGSEHNVLRVLERIAVALERLAEVHAPETGQVVLDAHHINTAPRVELLRMLQETGVDALLEKKAVPTGLLSDRYLRDVLLKYMRGDPLDL